MNTKNTTQELDGIAETLWITLYIRAMETQRPDALIHDEKAVELVQRLSYDFSKIKQIQMDEMDRITLILRNRQFDCYVQDFLSRCPDGVVVHIGCGLDSRFERVDNGRVKWYDLDLPEVIEMRQKYLGGEQPRYHHLACSAFDLAWLDQVGGPSQQPYLFIAEGVFMYFPEAQVKSLVMALHERFPGAELAFDTFSPFLVWITNLRFSMTHYGARYHWSLKRGQELETWASGIRLLGEWSYFDSPEPRLDPVRWMRRVPFWARVLCIYHYRLGSAGVKDS